ncbi:MAG TPA: hypothetical protein VHQ22_03215 [Terriglobales bacterium]|jgi:hypothetical protein|nr:hypothetical protein [Terriglobales bacterium]
MTKHKHALTAVKNPTFDLCAGAHATADSTTLTFVNHHNASCLIGGLGGLVDCGNSFTVDPQSSRTCNILPGAAAGTYEYSASCCRQEQNPSIIYQ